MTQGIVTSGFVHHAGKVLLVRRNADEPFLAGYWELPGGKLEEGETLTEGLLRELREEIGCACTVGAVFDAYTYTTSKGVHVVDIAFLCTPDEPDEQIRLTEHDAWSWVSQDELHEYLMSPEKRASIERGFTQVL